MANGPPFSGRVAVSGLLGLGIGSLQVLCLHMTIQTHDADLYPARTVMGTHGSSVQA